MTQATLLSPEEKTLWQIRQAKLAYLNRLFTVSNFQPVADEMFKETPKNIDYFSCHYSVMLTSEEIQADLSLIGQCFESFPPEVVVALGKIGQDMQRIGYKPPLDITEQRMHLTAMWNLYKADFTWPPTQEDLWLDFSYIKLIIRVHAELQLMVVEGVHNKPRTRNSTIGKRKKAWEWQQFVIAIYEHGEPIAPGTKLSEAFEMIRKQFDESKKSALQKSGKAEPQWGVIPDSVTVGKKERAVKMGQRDSLVTLFKTEGIRERDFEKRGQYWFKKENVT